MSHIIILLIKRSLLNTIDKNFGREIIKQYKDIVNDAIIETFENLTISKVSRRQLISICRSLCGRDMFNPDLFSGVVIAGYGNNDYFPSSIHLNIDSIINNIIKFKVANVTKISHNNPSSIGAYAQKEMVIGFMEGMETELNDFNRDYVAIIFENYANAIAEMVTDSQEAKKKILDNLKKLNANLLKDYHEKLSHFKRIQYISPVINAVSILPKDELALMAETLVNLTSFKRRVSMELETVGGPVDVALISKGDGFIWVKRKHYFDGQLNYQFYKNYYNEPCLKGDKNEDQ